MEDEKMERVDLLDVLLDDNNTAPIYMHDGNGKRLKFEQVAVIPYGEDDLYCILKPTTHIEGVAEDEALVFKVMEAEGEHILIVENDEMVAIEVFMEYYRLVEENLKKEKF